MDRKKLPKVLSDIARIAGIEKAIRISRELGGHRFWMSGKVSERHCLIGYLSGDELRALSRAYEGQQVEIPTSGLRKRYRIAELLEQGLSAGAIAREVKVTRRWVRQVRKDLGQE